MLRDADSTEMYIPHGQKFRKHAAKLVNTFNIQLREIHIMLPVFKET